MADPIVVSKIAEQGGAAVAVSSLALSALSWLNANSAAVLAVCGIVGAGISAAGLFIGWYYKHQRELRERLAREWRD